MKSATVSRGLSLYICIVLALAGSLFTACTKAKKEGPVRAITTFVIGKVILVREGEPARPIRHKEELKQGDVVKTGSDSMLVIQIGEDSVVKIESKTAISMAQLLDRGNTRLNLGQGKVLTRVRNLGKESTFKVYTKTSLAAVRGTEFSVAYENNQSVVAVNDGSVEVRKVAAGKETKEEKTIDSGNAAVVKNTITTRPVNAEEKKEFDRLAKITPVEDLDDKSEADLKQMENDYQKNTDTDVDADTETEKEKGKDKKDNDKKKEKAAAEEKPAENNAAKKTVLWTSKSVYSPSDTIIVYYKNMPEYRNCWIDISKASDGEGRYQSYQWTYSAKNGQMTFARMNLGAGVYEVRAHFSRSSSVDKRFRFQVR